MKRGTILVVPGIVLMLGGPAAAWIISSVQEGRAQVAANSGAPAEVLAEYMAAALHWTLAGYVVCALGIIVLIAGLVMRARGGRARAGGPGLAA